MIQIGTARISIPGGMMYSEEECKKDSRKLQHHSLMAEWKDRSGKHKERVVFNTRKCMPALLIIPIWDEAYNYWISDSSSLMSPKHWKRLSKNDKVIAHLNQIAANYQGTLLDWNVTLD